MKTWGKRFASMFIMCILVLSLFTGCGASKEQNDVERLISDFESACQSFDLNAVVDCFDPRVSGPVRGVAELFGVSGDTVAGLIYGAVGSDVFAENSALAQGADGLVTCLRSFQIEPTDFRFNNAKDTCDVTATFSVEVEGSTLEREGVLRCIQRDGVWYITIA